MILPDYWLQRPSMDIGEQVQSDFDVFGTGKNR